MPQKRPTILVVDGDPLHRESIRHILRYAGYRVLEATDYRGAQNMHHQHLGEIDLLLTAIALPGGNGFELSKTMLASEPGIRVLFVSGETGTKVGEFYSALSIDIETLRRPFDPNALLLRVRSVLDPPQKSTALA